MLYVYSLYSYTRILSALLTSFVGSSTSPRPETTCPAGHHLATFIYGSHEFVITQDGDESQSADSALLGSEDVLTIRVGDGDAASLSIRRRLLAHSDVFFGLKSLSLVVSGVDNVTVSTDSGSSETVR